MNRTVEFVAKSAGCLLLAAWNLASEAAAPNAPTNLQVTAVSAMQLRLSWADNSGDEDGFKVERSPDGVHFLQVAQLLPNTTVYRDQGLWPGSAFTYRVCAYNADGNSGYSETVTNSTPSMCPNTLVGWGQAAPPAGLTDLVVISAGVNDGLGVEADGTVLGWGNNDYGKATPPLGLTGVVAVAAGDYHSLALKNDGTVVGWGYDYSGEATPPGGLTNVVTIAAGGAHSLALKSDGTVVGWGYNAFGQASPPTGLHGVVAISAGEEHSLALESDGTVVAWGHNQYGQASVPADVTNIVAIAAGDWHSLALRADGTVLGWGYSYAGETTTPAGLTNVVAIGAGDYFSIGLKSDGTVLGWGYPRATAPPAGLSGVTAVAVGFGHCVALTCAPFAPSDLALTAVSSNQVHLAWVDNAATEEGFAIERALDTNGLPGTWSPLASVGSDETNYDDSTVQASAKYWYRIQAYNSGGTSPYGNPATIATPPLAPPTSLTATVVSAFQVNLVWADQSATEDGFKIERAPDSNDSPGAWSLLATVGANLNTFSDIGLTECTRYWYRVRAYSGGTESPPSNQASALTQLGPPSNLVATPAFTNRIDLAWTNNSFIADGFRIERATSSPNNQSWRPIGTNLASVTTFSDSSVLVGTNYYYRVRAFKGQTNSAYSAWATANTANADSDGDGIPDVWMLRYFGHPAGQAADHSLATDDADGDRVSNLFEYLAGTNPTNRASYFHITSLVLTGATATVTWTIVGGKRYAVQASASPQSPFADLSPVLAAGGTAEGVTNYTELNAPTNGQMRCYRIRLAQ